MSIKNKKGGFTLIELLVVIAIIGILSSVVLTSLNTGRKKARDARRQSDIRQIALSMEMAYDDNEAYVDLPDTAIAIAAGDTRLNPYLNPVPLDITNSGNQIYYWTDTGDNQKYCVWAQLETPTTATYIVANSKGVKESTTVPTVTNCATL